ncbi:DJ-1/PfpI family protein [uncultured Fibrobacter sp.]|uniref:DJ-1/PfpI family protein n=1 Tax=uncultured Fibrobacter sp. TaxID=261512 RepID=UPI0026239A4C|nr:DJ-1/PfpI family protein [uncultured Fibrobacter sp.]
MDIMQEHYEEGGTVAAICAAPSVVLSLLPDITGKKMTCYDGFEEALQAKGAEYVKEGVVTDGNIITGRGPGWAVEFGLAILAHIKGQETADKVKAGNIFEQFAKDAGSDPLLLLRARESAVESELNAAKLETDIYDLYLELLQYAGKLSKEGVQNHLVGGLK